MTAITKTQHTASAGHTRADACAGFFFFFFCVYLSPRSLARRHQSHDLAAKEKSNHVSAGNLEQGRRYEICFDFPVCLFDSTPNLSTRNTENRLLKRHLRYMLTSAKGEREARWAEALALARKVPFHYCAGTSDKCRRLAIWSSGNWAAVSRSPRTGNGENLLTIINVVTSGREGEREVVLWNNRALCGIRRFEFDWHESGVRRERGVNKSDVNRDERTGIEKKERQNEEWSGYASRTAGWYLLGRNDPFSQTCSYTSRSPGGTVLPRRTRTL